MLQQSVSRLLLGGMACAALMAPTSAHATPIEYNSFTINAAISRPSEAFAAKLAALTRTTLGESGVLEFRKQPDNTPVPGGFAEGDVNVLKAVGAGVRAGGLDAAFVTGLHLNSAWGFLYTSGVPFGPNFDEYLGFLYGKVAANGKSGLELLQSTLDENGENVVVVPIVGNSEQGSGYFPRPLGDVRVKTCRRGVASCDEKNQVSQHIHGIGLAGLCGEHWRLRYVAPALSVIDHACDRLVQTGRIPEKNIDFVVPIPGQGVFAAMVAGEIQGFEVATPMDDMSSLFAKPGINPGTVGARFLHFPGWHQQFLVSYMIINRDLWNTWTEAQHALVYTMGRENMLSSYAETLQQQGQNLQSILLANRGDNNPSNDMVLAQWPKRDLKFLQDEAIAFLNEHAQDTTFPQDDLADYGVILETLRKFVSSNSAYWKIRSVDSHVRFDDWFDDATGQPWEQYLK
jgi:hypothetical protein